MLSTFKKVVMPLTEDLIVADWRKFDVDGPNKIGPNSTFGTCFFSRSEEEKASGWTWSETENLPTPEKECEGGIKPASEEM